MENFKNITYISNSPSGVRGYKAVFIDLDDTIWDFHTNARLALKDIFELHNLHKIMQFDVFFDIYAKRNLELWDAYGKGEITKEFLMLERMRYPLGKMGIQDDLLAQKVGDEYLDNLPEKKTLMPHALEMLDYLSEKYPLTIISNGFVEVQYRKMRSSGIEHYFKHVVLSEAAGALKPDRKIFDYALGLNKVNNTEAIMIGDSYEADIIGAQNAEIDQVYYPLSKPDQPKLCTYQINSLLDLKNFL